MEKRKYYIQSYEFTMLGFLIDENEFEVSPAISRVLQVYEVDTRTISRGKSNKIPNDQINLTALFKIGNNVISENFDYTTDLTITNLNNIDSYDVYINNEYYGVDVNVINVNMINNSIQL
jgi:hypothetical protein